MDTGASVSVVGKYLAHKLGIWKRARKVNVGQVDRSFLQGKFVVNKSYLVMDSSIVLGNCAMDVKVLYLRNCNIIFR